MPTLAQRRGGGQKGGSRARAVMLTGIPGLPDILDLSISGNRLAILAGILRAIAEGKVSSLAATTAVAVLREARAEGEADWEKLALKQAEVIERLQSALPHQR